MIKIINFRFYFSFFFLLFDLYSQYGRGGWFHGYSFTCQPVDYSLDEMAVRVSFKIKAGEIIKRRTKFKWAKANEKTLKKKTLNWTERNGTERNWTNFYFLFFSNEEWKENWLNEKLLRTMQTRKNDEITNWILIETTLSSLSLSLDSIPHPLLIRQFGYGAPTSMLLFVTYLPMPSIEAR